MAITQQNLYIPGFNVPSIATNIDYDRLGVDKSVISVDYSVSPAVVTVKKGSIIEANGDTYLVDNDEVFAMANAAHNYITFDGTTFSSAATIGTWSTIKQGYYNGTVRTLRHYVDQSGCGNAIMIDLSYQNLLLATKKYDRIKVGLSSDISANYNAILQLNNVLFDQLGNWDIASYKFISSESGYYKLSISILMVNATARPHRNQYALGYIINGVNLGYGSVLQSSGTVYPSMPGLNRSIGIDLIYLKKDEYIQYYLNFSPYGGYISSNIIDTSLKIERIL